MHVTRMISLSTELIDFIMINFINIFTLKYIFVYFPKYILPLSSLFIIDLDLSEIS